jgi:hypothetical protein
MKSNEEILAQLKMDLAMARKTTAEKKRDFLLKKRELLNIETEFVEAKITEERAENKLQTFFDAKIGEHDATDTHRDWQIADYRTRLKESLEKISDEEDMVPLGILDLKEKS